jgi:5-(carboxyamino)imidazole ribonucleotide synthase
MSFKRERIQSIGVLGAGQLARFLVEAARSEGLKSVVMAEKENDSAVAVADRAIVARPDEAASLYHFLSKADRVIFENEFVSLSFIETLVASKKKRFVPQPSVIFQLQNKIRQKRLFDELSIPHADYQVFSVKDQNREEFLGEISERLGKKVAFKWAEQGYDGKGVLLAEAPDEGRSFLKTAEERGVDVYAEKAISFRRELALVSVRSDEGDFLSWPLVETSQVSGVCQWVRGPVSLENKEELTLQRWVKKIAEHLGIVGVFAIEIFEIESGSFLVNELAPRVHNSGHWSMDYSLTSQFENHIKAVIGKKLGKTTATQKDFAMWNLIGPPGVQKEANLESLPPLPPYWKLYWYDKKEVRPGRKMGHINLEFEEGAWEETLKDLQNWNQLWVESLGKE